jgi:isopenicillin N synthase-like dioxygenase
VLVVLGFTHGVLRGTLACARVQITTFKERVQFRLPGCPSGSVVSRAESAVVSLEEAAMVAPRGKADFGELQPSLVEGAAVMRRIAVHALTALLRGAGVDPTGVLEGCVAETDSCASVSVLNIYHYFNKPADGGGAGDVEHSAGAAATGEAATGAAEAAVAANCPVHTDPGLVSVLARASAKGLEVAVGRQKVTACCAGTNGFHSVATDGHVSTTSTTCDMGERDGGGGSGDEGGGGSAKGEENDGAEWVCGESLYNDNQVMVIVGESLCRLTGFLLPACVHRVVHNEDGRDRINAIYELRPSVHIYEEWGAKQPSPPAS